MYKHFIIPYLYEAQHVSGDISPIIRSLKQHWQPLVFDTWKFVGRVVGGRCQEQCAWQRPPTTRPTTFHVWKTRGCQCSFRLLMMDDVSPETCWALYKYGIIKFWYIVASCCIFLYESYYDARIHEHQEINNGWHWIVGRLGTGAGLGFLEQRNYPCLCRELNHSASVVQTVTQSLYWLSYPSSESMKNDVTLEDNASPSCSPIGSLTSLLQ